MPSSDLITNILNGYPSQGRFVDEAGQTQNIADLVRKFGIALDPFGSLRTTEYHPIFSSQPLAISTMNDRVITTGSAAITVDGGEYKLTNPGGETCRLESGQRGRYQAGLVGAPGIGVRRSTAPAGTTAYRYGYFDDDDGFGFKEDSAGLHTFVRQGGVETYTKARADWLDPLDGTGPSGRTLDPLDGHIHRMPFAWYGYATVVFGVLMPDAPGNDDEIVIVDRWSPTNEISFPNPNLPMSAEIAGDTPGELFVGGRQYGVYGNLSLRPRISGDLRTEQPIDTADGFIPLISGRVRDASPWNKIPIQIEGISLQTDVNLDWIIVLGGTLNNDGEANWSISQFSAGDTSTEYNIASTTLSGGEIMSGPAFVRGGSGANLGAESQDIPDQDIPIGVPVTLAARAHSGTGTVRSALRMAELR